MNVFTTVSRGNVIMIASVRKLIPSSFGAWVNKIVAGLIIAFMLIILSFSLAGLLFSNQLAPYLAQGVGILLISTAVGLFIAGVLSSQHHIIPAMQSSLILVIASMTANMAITPENDLLVTTLILLPLTALTVGIVYLLFGQLRVVRFIRYVPYPVIGGFLAGNGVLLIIGAFQVMTPFDLTMSAVASLFMPDNLIIWIPGIMIGGVLFAALRQSSRYFLLPLILMIGVAAIYGLIYATGLTLSTAATRGILPGAIGDLQYQHPIMFDLDLVDWIAIQSQWANILAVVMVAIIHLPLNLTGIELIKQDDFDIDREVRSNGTMNIIIALVGGNVGFSSATMSTMNHKIGGTSRLTYVIAIATILLVLYFGSQVLTYIPVAIIGALLIFLGLEFIDAWIVQGRNKFTQSEYVVAFIIMLTVIFIGFLEGVILGVFVMLLVFVGTYSRISNIYRSVSVKNLSSTVERNPHFTEELFRLRDHVYLLELTGFLFFGQADSIVNEARTRINDALSPDLLYLIIDFRRVAGVDSSALLSLNRVLNLAEIHDFRVIFSNFEDNPSTIRIIEELNSGDRLEFSSDLDHAIEHTETALLEYAGTTQAFVASVIWMQLKELGMNSSDAKELAKHMQRQQYEPESIIITQGEEANTIYFIEVGQVSIYLDYDTENPIRLRTFEMGSIIGEIGYFLEKPRTATVVADTHAFVLHLTRDTLKQIKSDNPELAFAFEAMMLKVVANRLSNSNRLLSVLR